MRVPRWIALAAFVLLCLSLGTIPAASVALETGSADSTTDEFAELGEPSQVILINLTADGHAEWTVETRFILEDEEDVERFEDYAEELEAGDRDVGYDADTVERFVDRSEPQADREMEIRNDRWLEPTVETVPVEEDGEVVDNVTVGAVRFAFSWTNFAQTDGDQVVLGDVFQSAGGTWFPALAEGQRLVIASPTNYGIQHAETAPQNGHLVWNGPHEFEPDEFHVTYLRGANDDDEPPAPAETILPWTLVGTLLLALVFVGYVAFALARDKPVPLLDRWLRADEVTAGTDRSVDTHEFDESTVVDDEDRVDPGDDAVEEAGTTGDGSAEASTTSSEDDVDLELLSDEERVLTLLRTSGGRMKQASIVEETQWSNAKVSQLLSKMDEDDEIDKLRIGRENLITLPEVDPTEPDEMR